MAIAPEIKLTIDNKPMPTPVASFGSDCDTVFDMETCIKVSITAMMYTDFPKKVDNKKNAENNKIEATKTSIIFPFRSAIFPPFFPMTAEASAAGTSMKPIVDGSN